MIYSGHSSDRLYPPYAHEVRTLLMTGHDTLRHPSDVVRLFYERLIAPNQGLSFDDLHPILRLAKPWPFLSRRRCLSV